MGTNTEKSSRPEGVSWFPELPSPQRRRR
ncbi:hypothetical protein NFI96_007624, partial [Prochilodus magdalenae]